MRGQPTCAVCTAHFPLHFSRLSFLASRRVFLLRRVQTTQRLIRTNAHTSQRVYDAMRTIIAHESRSAAFSTSSSSHVCLSCTTGCIDGVAWTLRDVSRAAALSTRCHPPCCKCIDAVASCRRITCELFHPPASPCPFDLHCALPFLAVPCQERSRASRDCSITPRPLLVLTCSVICGGESLRAPPSAWGADSDRFSHDDGKANRWHSPSAVPFWRFIRSLEGRFAILMRAFSDDHTTGMLGMVLR